ncbi:STAS domain-containing protein [Streptomyces hygroscopicus]|uniref:STAS domain-containing protein n=1 Tax=Streptomyces hygroscopicus TaxID=1912 RepID=UPI0004CA905E|nr:STAS domain-containing protein [Streptomyces hygroscopicus]
MAGPEPENPPAPSPATPSPATPSPPAPSPPALVLSQPVTRAEVERLCRRLSALVGGPGPGSVAVDVGGVRRPDLAVVEALARLRLTARRLGCGIQLLNAGGELLRLLAWTGLDEALTAPAPSGRAPGPEPRGEAEQREEALGVQEGVEPRDPAA